MLVRGYRSADESTLHVLLAETHAVHVALLPERFRQPDAPLWSAEYLASLTADERARLLVAEADGQVVGFALVKLREAPVAAGFQPRTTAMVEAVGVAAAARRAGVGRALMAAAEAWAAAHGAVELELQVYEANAAARAFYAALGFATASRRLSRRIG